jgi:hypothetical protein
MLPLLSLRAIEVLGKRVRAYSLLHKIDSKNTLPLDLRYEPIGPRLSAAYWRWGCFCDLGSYVYAEAYILQEATINVTTALVQLEVFKSFNT